MAASTCSYQKEVERLRKLYEEVDSDEECIDHEDDSDADPEYVEVSEHDSDSEQELETVDIENFNNQTDNYKGKDGMKWKSACPPKNVRTRSCNIITHLPGTRGKARTVKTPQECWDCLVDEEMINMIVVNTNIYINKMRINETSTYKTKDTDATEIKAVFGLLYIAGVLHGGRMNLEEFWTTDGTGCNIFPVTMGIIRFRFLLASIRLDNVHTREERRKVDKLAAVRLFFDAFVNNCKSSYVIGEYATLDEMLWAFRGRCGFRMYIANKPAKYGLKIFALTDARTYYTVNMEIYAGSQIEGPYAVSNTTNDLVERITGPLHGTSRNITMDNWFTSVEIAKKLLSEHKLTVVGTIRKNKRQIPPEFLQTKNREVFSTMFGFTEDITLASYVSKKGKCVLMLSTLHHDNNLDLETGDKKKPEIISFYNVTKGGVDSADQLCSNYNVARNTRRWPMVILYGVLNIAGIFYYYFSFLLLLQ